MLEPKGLCEQTCLHFTVCVEKARQKRLWTVVAVCRSCLCQHVLVRSFKAFKRTWFSRSHWGYKPRWSSFGWHARLCCCNTDPWCAYVSRLFWLENDSGITLCKNPKVFSATFWLNESHNTHRGGCVYHTALQWLDYSSFFALHSSDVTNALRTPRGASFSLCPSITL